MAKYCLTECAKKKLTKFGNGIVEIISALIVAVIITGIAMAIFTIVGGIMNLIADYYDLPNKLKYTGIFDTMGLGSSILLLGGFLFIIIYHIVMVIKWIFFVIKETVAGLAGYTTKDTTRCKLFERCE